MNILITFGGSNNSIAQKILNNLINFHEYKLNIKIIIGKFNSSVNINTKHTIHSITYIKFVKSIFTEFWMFLEKTFFLFFLHKGFDAY